MKALLTYIKGKILIVHIFEKRNISIEGRKILNIVSTHSYSHSLQLLEISA